MRREWRNVLAVGGLFLVGTAVAAAPPESSKEGRSPGGDVVRLTVELSWGMPRTGIAREHGAVGVPGVESDPEFVLEMSEGRVIEALAWPPEDTKDPRRLSSSGPGPEGSWRLGKEPEGRVRARIE